jgi:hypothetical protein
MPLLSYSFPVSRSTSPISPDELVARYFLGIELTDPNGNPLPADSIQFYIDAAVEEFEGYLNLKLTKQIVRETLHYSLSDFHNWGFIPVSYPVNRPFVLQGYASGVRQVSYPVDWVSRKTSSVSTDVQRSLYLVPGTGQVSISGSAVYAGILPHLGWKGAQTIPNYWDIVYCTSFDKPPADILDAVGKLASINIFHQLGDIILGAGIANESISIDGLSQSIGTTSSATNAGYGARIIGYTNDLKKGLPRLKAKYDGMVIMSM